MASYNGWTGSTSVNMYDTTSMNGNVVRVIPSYTPLVVTVAASGWYSTTKGGVSGYVRTSTVTTFSLVTSGGSFTISANADNSIIRDCPTTQVSYHVSGIKKGTQYTAYEMSDTRYKPSWYMVIMPNGDKKYASKSAFSKVP